MNFSSENLKKRLRFAVVAALLVACAEAAAQAAPETMLERMYGPYAPLVRELAKSVLQLAIIGLVVLPFQWLLPGVRRQAKYRSYEFWLDIVYWFQGLWLSLISFFVAVDWAVIAIFGGKGHWIPVLATLPFWLQVLIAVWAFDLAVYWRHRWEHRIAALWSFHAVHHTAEKVDVLTTTRLHPFELALGMLFNTVVVHLGLSAAATALGFTIYMHYNYYIHTNVRIRFAGFMKYVLVTPFMHQWHHAKDEAAMGRNLGVVFAWNDWLFGTAHHPEHWPSEFGLSAPPGERVGQSYLRQLVYPVQFALARTLAWRAARAGQTRH